MTDDLLQRQVALQAEAGRVYLDLDLHEFLSGVGDPVRVGSAALGLMVWRDLDITVVCRALHVDAVTAIGARLSAHPQVREVMFRNDTGQWNSDPAYPDGLYLGLRHRSLDGHDWKIDIWFVDEPDRQPDLAHLRTMPARLSPATCLTILRLKEAWWRRPEYGQSVRSYDIYTSVLDHGVRTVEQFADWLERRAR